MKFMGINVEIKKAPKWVPYDVFMEVYESLQDVQAKVEALEKRAEANRVRISQVANAKSSGEAEEILSQGKTPADPIAEMLKGWGGN